MRDTICYNTKHETAALFTKWKKIVQKNRMQLSANFKKNIIYSIIS